MSFGIDFFFFMLLGVFYFWSYAVVGFEDSLCGNLVESSCCVKFVLVVVGFFYRCIDYLIVLGTVLLGFSCSKVDVFRSGSFFFLFLGMFLVISFCFSIFNLGF